MSEIISDLIQLRYYGKDNPDEQTLLYLQQKNSSWQNKNLSLLDLNNLFRAGLLNGSIFNNILPAGSIGISTLPGVGFVIKPFLELYKIDPIFVGGSGVIELPLLANKANSQMFVNNNTLITNAALNQQIVQLKFLTESIDMIDKAVGGYLIIDIKQTPINLKRAFDSEEKEDYYYHLLERNSLLS